MLQNYDKRQKLSYGGSHSVSEEFKHKKVTKMTDEKLVLALPKGRISEEVVPLLEKAGIIPEEAFFNKKSRLLRFSTNLAHLDIIRVRSFDVPTFVAFGAASCGISGSDVLTEFDNPEIYAPLDLGIARCRISVAEKKEEALRDHPSQWSHVRIATKYPSTTKRYFAARGVQAECIKLNGAMELAPNLGLCRLIVDLVDSGRTLEENGLIEVEKIADVSSYFIINRTALKTRNVEIQDILTRFEKAVNE
jgi:ATP phosphoribosyltransferase